MATIEQAGTTAMPPYFGTVLRNGSSGPDSAQVQTWLNGVHTRWPQVPSVTVDGQYGSNTANAVKAFQTVAGLTADGQVGSSTWNALYAAFADIRGAGEVFCGITARSGDRGAVVKSMQQKLIRIRQVYTAIASISADGAFGSASAAALKQFQRQFALGIDGAFGRNTFAALAKVYGQVLAGAPTPVLPRYPGLLQQGSTGDSVRCVQSYLSALGGVVPKVTIDGRFGSATAASVRSFQRLARLAEDGKVGPATWSALVMAFNGTLRA